MINFRKGDKYLVLELLRLTDFNENFIKGYCPIMTFHVGRLYAFSIYNVFQGEKRNFMSGFSSFYYFDDT